MHFWTLPIHALPNTYDRGVLSQLCVAQGLDLVCVLVVVLHTCRLFLRLIVGAMSASHV